MGEAEKEEEEEEEEEEERRQPTPKPARYLLLLLLPEVVPLEPAARFHRLQLVEVDAAVYHPFSNFAQLEEGNV